VVTVAFVAASLVLAPRASSQSGDEARSMPVPLNDTGAAPPNPDPRAGLKAGWPDAGQASWNMRLVAAMRPADPFFDPRTPNPNTTNTDLAFQGKYVIQGNYDGFQIWDVSNPSEPRTAGLMVCRGGQGDVTVYHNLLFLSVEDRAGRLDCGNQGVPDTVSKDRFRGVRIFDISDVAHPKQIADVQLCRGSHTNTLVEDPNDKAHIYIYSSGNAGSRPSSELAGCSETTADDDPDAPRFLIEVIKVPLAHPEQAKVVSTPRILNQLAPVTYHAPLPEDQARRAAAMAARAAANGGAPAGPTHTAITPVVMYCHDITIFQATGRAGAACIGYGLLLDVRDPANPKRVAAAADSNIAVWHSATFSNDGKKVVFGDEWTGPHCRATDNKDWGGLSIYGLAHDSMQFKNYYKIPAGLAATAGCTAHNGSLIPVPGRDIAIYSWYQGGLSVVDWSDASHPKEIAFYTLGPDDSTKVTMGGFWSTYWYNGHIYGSEITRGLDVLELQPNGLLSQNEIDAAKSVHLDIFNPQNQPKIVWPATFALARAYLDQLGRNDGLSAEKRAAVERSLAAAEKQSADARKTSLTTLATKLDGDAATASDAARVRMLATAVRRLAAA
jgi:hypothetical protein